jgi:hypothetical protein
LRILPTPSDNPPWYFSSADTPSSCAQSLAPASPPAA